MMFKIKKGNFNIFENRDFIKLWFSQILSQPASHMLNFILAIRVFQLSGSSFLVSVLVSLVSIPPIIFSSMAGVLADSMNRKYILITSNLLRAVVVAAFILYGHSYYAILVLAFLISTISQFFGPAETSSIPTLAQRKNLFAANSLFLFTLYTSFLIGYSLAGPLLSWLGENIYFVLILSYLLATLMDILLPPLNYHLKDTEAVGKNIRNGFKIMWDKLKEGILYIKGFPLLLITVLQFSFVFSAERAVIALIPEFATKILNFNISQIGYFLIAPVGLGALMGAISANRMKEKFSKRKIINIGIMVAAFALTLLPLYELFEKQAYLFSYSPLFYWALISYLGLLAFLSGLADVVIIVTAQTMLQEETQHEKRGRVFGNLTMFMNLVGLPLILLVGFLATRYSVSKIILVLGIVTIIVSALSWVVNKRKLDPLYN